MKILHEFQKHQFVTYIYLIHILPLKYRNSFKNHMIIQIFIPKLTKLSLNILSTLNRVIP